MSVSSVAALSPWTDEYVETAGKLWADGWSATQVSKELRRRFGLAVTRNAVIGVLHRRGLAGRGVASRPTTYSDRPPPRPKRPKVNRRVRIAAHGTFVEPTPRPPRVVIPFRQDATGTRTILTVGLGECRWPCGDPLREDFTLCGDDAPDGPYCPTHHAHSVQPPTTSKAKNAHDLARSLRRYV